MSRPATYDDAQLLLRLYELRREPRMRDGRRWFIGTFKAKTFEEWQETCPPGTDANEFYRMVTTYWEMAASFVTSGVLHPDVFCHNCLESLVVWTKVSAFIGRVREANKNPGSLKNLEAAATLFQQYMDRQAPGTYDAFIARWK
jgi:hypothetical protein